LQVSRLFCFSLFDVIRKEQVDLVAFVPDEHSLPIQDLPEFQQEGSMQMELAGL
jgi:hypothetical protein